MKASIAHSVDCVCGPPGKWNKRDICQLIYISIWLISMINKVYVGCLDGSESKLCLRFCCLLNFVIFTFLWYLFFHFWFILHLIMHSITAQGTICRKSVIYSNEIVIAAIERREGVFQSSAFADWYRILHCFVVKVSHAGYTMFPVFYVDHRRKKSKLKKG